MWLDDGSLAYMTSRENNVSNRPIYGATIQGKHMPDPLIQVQNVSVSFANRLALEHVSMEVNRGEIVTLIGPNGAGKTTLVRVILGLLQPSSGRVLQQSGMRIGYMPQKLHIDKSLPLSVQRFMGLAQRDKQAISDCLNMTGIGQLVDQPLQTLSGGEMQRVLLARAMLRSPDLLVLDEPVQGVDVSGQAHLYNLIGSLRDKLTCGVLMISHDLHMVMAKTDSVVCLNRHVCCQGQPDSVSEHPAYLEMFGHAMPNEIAVYAHHHDHKHTNSGTIENESKDPH